MALLEMSTTLFQQRKGPDMFLKVMRVALLKLNDEAL